MTYDDEYKLKDYAFKKFLHLNGVKQDPEKLTPSLQARFYRTTSKRRVIMNSKGLGFGFSNNIKPGIFTKSLLELPEHEKIYDFLFGLLSTNLYLVLARALNWLVIRGSANYPYLIVNIYQTNSKIISKL